MDKSRRRLGVSSRPADAPDHPSETARAWLAALLDSADDAMVGSTFDGRIVSWNRGAERLFGHAAAAVVGRSVAVIVPGDLRQEFARQRGALARGEAVGRVATGRLASDGRRLRVSSTLSAINGAEGSPIGVLEVARLEDAQPPRVEPQRAELLTRLFYAQDNERRRIARDLHDQMGQQLTALRLALAVLMDQSGAQSAVRHQLETLLALAQQLDDDVSFRVSELRPLLDDGYGLLGALQQFLPKWSRHFGIGVELHTPRMPGASLLPAIEAQIFRIIQEALNNVAKHARARHVEVALERTASHFMVAIDDDGVGFASGDGSSDGYGLVGMRERALLLGADFEIDSSDGGTSVVLRYPMPAATAKAVQP